MFHSVMDRYGDEILRFVYWHVQDLPTAEDLTQEVFLRAYRALPRFREESSHRTWIYAIARNVCRDHARKTRRQWAETDACPVLVTDSAEQVVVARLEAERLFECLKRLEVSRRMAIILYYLQNWRAPEIAELMRVPVGTVRSKLHRAKSQLAQCLGGDNDD